MTQPLQCYRSQLTQVPDTTSNLDRCFLAQSRYMLGDNGDSSYVVGFGKSYPQYVQSMGASCPGTPNHPLVRASIYPQPTRMSCRLNCSTVLIVCIVFPGCSACALCVGSPPAALTLRIAPFGIPSDLYS